MNHGFRLLGSVLIVLFIGIASVLGAPQFKPTKKHIRGKLRNGRAFTLIVQIKKYPGTQKDDGSWWGTDGGIPDTIISYMAFWVGKKPAMLPFKTYTDICNVNESSVSVQETKQGIQISMSGGDAAGSFTAQYLIRHQKQGYRLWQRIVRSGENPDEIWEKTEYHNEAWDW